MKQMFKASSLALLGILFLCSCGKTNEAPKMVLNEMEDEAVFQLPIVLTAEYELPEGAEESSKPKSLFYNLGDGTTPTTIKQEAKQGYTYRSHLYIRNAANTVQFYAGTIWREMGRQGNKVFLEAQMSSPHNYTFLVLQFGANGTGSKTPKPQVGETWYIASIMGGAIPYAKPSNWSRPFISFKGLNGDALAVNEAEIPYYSKFQPITIGTDANAPKLRLHFKPVGTQILVDVESNGQLSESNLPDFQLASNLLSDKGFFNFSLDKTALTDDVPYYEYKSVGSADLLGDVGQFPLLPATDIITRKLKPRGNGKYSALIWGMPRPSSGTYAVADADVKTRPYVDGYVVSHSNSTTGKEHGVRLGRLLSGRQYYIPLKIYRQRPASEAIIAGDELNNNRIDILP